MEAQYWCCVGVAGFFGFIAGAWFGAWVQMNAYRQIGRAIKQVVVDLEEEDDATEWE